jgi:hypothetical protein
MPFNLSTYITLLSFQIEQVTGDCIIQVCGLVQAWYLRVDQVNGGGMLIVDLSGTRIKARADVTPPSTVHPATDSPTWRTWKGTRIRPVLTHLKMLWGWNIITRTRRYHILHNTPTPL